jgi:formylglycine-generating enzyme required for sulfatase activity
MSRILLVMPAFIASVIATMGLPDAALAQKRVAFVVGTDKYDNVDKTRQLQRAVNDARAVGAAFKALGFEVIAAENLTRGQFNNEWQKFLDKLAAGDTAAIYYAGHGVEIEGLNFLLPRDIPDIKFGRQEQIKRESLSVAEILLDLRGRNPEIALVILDACRDNPLIPDEMRSVGTRGGGLAALKGEPPKGTFIMYSAGAGESALDRLPGNDPDRENSIFTRKLVPLLKTKGLALHDMARQLRVDVIELASTVPHSQRPAYYDGVVGKYCLAGCEAEIVATPKPAGEPKVATQAPANCARASKEVCSQNASCQWIDGSPGYCRQRVTTGSIAEAERKRPPQQGKDRTHTEAGAMKPGSVFRECPDCPEMVVVPAGVATIGSPEGEPGHEKDEAPQRNVMIDAFALGKFEATFAEWDACVTAKACKHKPDDYGWGRGRRPVINTSWEDITREYLSWLSRKTGKVYRLPTEEEWEYAARAGTTTPFSTGKTITSDRANIDGNPIYDGGAKGMARQKTSNVGSFAANAFGLHDMHGNVWELVEDCYRESYVSATKDCHYRILRGGSWFLGAQYARSAIRLSNPPNVRANDIGFRVARTLESRDVRDGNE